MDYNWGMNLSRCIERKCSVVGVLGCFCSGNQEYDRWNMMLIIQLSYLENDQLKSRFGSNCLDRFLWCGPLKAVRTILMLR